MSAERAERLNWNALRASLVAADARDAATKAQIARMAATVAMLETRCNDQHNALNELRTKLMVARLIPA